MAKPICACKAPRRVLMRKHGSPEGSDVSDVNGGNLEGGRKASRKRCPIDETRCDAVTKVVVVTVLGWAASSQDRHDVAHAEEVNGVHTQRVQASVKTSLVAIVGATQVLIRFPIAMDLTAVTEKSATAEDASTANESGLALMVRSSLTQLPLRTSLVFVVLCKSLWGREPATGFEPVTC